MGMAKTLRLMSPEHRRIVELNPASPVDARTDEQLRLLGWIDYLGQGEADAQGWFIPNTDTTLTPPRPSRLFSHPADRPA